MLFNARAVLAEIRKERSAPATFATSATQRTQKARNVAKVANVATPRSENGKTAPGEKEGHTDDFKHGFSLNGYPKTWTGKIVSLEEWRQLSAWEMHGPDRRHWNGKTRRWE